MRVVLFLMVTNFSFAFYKEVYRLRVVLFLMVTKLLNCASFPFKSLRVVLFLMVTKPYVDACECAPV